MNPDVELNYKETPQRFWGEIQAVPRQSLIVVDEIQKVPALLNYVQLGIEQLQHRFILSGSSARKLRRGAANLLDGRAIEQHLHPLSTAEIGEPFDLTLALSYGTHTKSIRCFSRKTSTRSVRCSEATTPPTSSRKFRPKLSVVIFQHSNASCELQHNLTVRSWSRQTWGDNVRLTTAR